MRTVLDLPESLVERAESRAAEKGVLLNDLVASLLERELRSEALPIGRRGHSEPIPVTVPSAGREFRHVSNADLFEALDQDSAR